MTDYELLSRYVGDGSEEAFGEIVERYSNMVYSTCLRRLGDHHLAEDACQSVFVALAKKAPRMSERVVLPAWLFRAARDSRSIMRRSRERAAKREEAFMTEVERERGRAGEAEWEGVGPHLDKAIDSLPARSRRAVVLHYLSGKPLKAVGEIIGCSEDAARMRISRAMAKLRRRLSKAGVSLTGTALVGFLGTRCTEAAPAGLVASMKNPGSLATGASPSVLGVAQGALRAMLWTKVKACAALVILVAAVGTSAAPLAKSMSGSSPQPNRTGTERPAVDVTKKGHKDFEYTTLGDSFLVEHAAFVAVAEHLDGPAREGMARMTIAVDADMAGNLYLFDARADAIRVVRKRDERLFTISGNGHITFGTPRKEGPAERLRLSAMIGRGYRPTFGLVGNPLEGEGSVYFATEESGVVVRLFRNKEKGGRWWYERVAGLGTKKSGAGVAASETRLWRPQIQTTPDGKVALIVHRGKKGKVLYWIRENTLELAYDPAVIEVEIGDAFACYGVDGKGNFVGTSGKGTKIVVVSPDGKTVKKIIPAPRPVAWSFFPDPRREQWFIKGMDDLIVTKILPSGEHVTLTHDGWKRLIIKSGGLANVKDALPWKWGIPMLDGRLGSSGYTSEVGPIFVGTYLKEGE